MKLYARIAALFILTAGATLGAGQTQPPVPQPPTFKVEVDYVEVDALVTDQRGTFVRDLKKEDFQVLEDGKPQTITTFSIIDIPTERANRPLFASQPIEPDVKTNAQPFDGRIYVMVLDDLHTTFGRSQRVKAAARQFIERHLGANDLMAVVHTSGPTDASQEFTGSKRLLLAAADRVMGRKVASSTVTRTEEYYRQQNLGMRQAGSPVNDPEEAERGFNARSSLRELKEVADWFGNVRGRRKTILFVSEGIDYDITDVFNNRSASMILDETRDTIAAATKSNVSIYGIDPRGLTSLGDESIEVQSFPDDTSLGIGQSSFQKEIQLSQDSLRVLSEETGGFAVVNKNDFSTAYDRIVRDNSSYYVLAYYPPNPKRDGRFHRIDVRVTRPGLTVARARRGYANPRGKAPVPTAASASNQPSAEVRDALNSPLPVSGVTMHVFAAPFKGTQSSASVLVGAEIRGRDLKLDANDKLEISYVAVDPRGKVRGGSNHSLTMNFRPERKALIEQTGLRVLSRVEIPPGRYQLRFAARDVGTGSVGSVLYDLEVPDFYKGALVMSGLALTSTAIADQFTAQPDEQLRTVLPGSPGGLRTFSQDDEIVLFAEVYDNEAASPHKVDITSTVTSDEGKVMYKTDEERSSADLLGKRGGYGYMAQIPIKDLPPGLYVLKVEARSRLGQGATAGRELQFTVVPAQAAPR